ncbi:MAG TPA: hypothetical protein VGM05_10090 [Planctomycetaceae bacterium]
MMSKIVRAGMLCLITGGLGLSSGCCGTFCNTCKVYQHPAPSCVGMHYAGCCTCDDDWRDLANQLTDTFLP